MIVRFHFAVNTPSIRWIYINCVSLLSSQRFQYTVVEGVSPLRPNEIMLPEIFIHFFLFIWFVFFWGSLIFFIYYFLNTMHSPPPTILFKKLLNEQCIVASAYKATIMLKVLSLKINLQLI